MTVAVGISKNTARKSAIIRAVTTWPGVAEASFLGMGNAKAIAAVSGMKSAVPASRWAPDQTKADIRVEPPG